MVGLHPKTVDDGVVVGVGAFDQASGVVVDLFEQLAILVSHAHRRTTFITEQEVCLVSCTIIVGINFHDNGCGDLLAVVIAADELAAELAFFEQVDAVVDQTLIDPLAGVVADVALGDATAKGVVSKLAIQILKNTT